MAMTRRATLTQAETIRQAEIALASSARIMEDWYFQRKNGWHHYWTPERCVSLATKNPLVKKLIWC